MAAIKIRKFLDERFAKQLTSWQTRMLASVIAGGYMVDPKKGNPALDAAMKLAIDELEAALLEDAEDFQKNRPQPVKENSFERIMQVFGGKVTVSEEVAHGG